MVYALLTSILIFVSSNVLSFHADDIDIGGWVNYTGTTNEYSLDSYPQVGLYGSLKTSINTSISGMWYRDPVYEKGRIGYLNGKYSTVIKDIPIDFSIGLVRSSWGIWSDYLIDPTTSPLLLQNSAIYNVRYESDIANRLGFNAKFSKNKLTVNTFIGSNYALDEDEFTKNTYIQDVKMNTDLGSLIYSTVEYRPYNGHRFKFNVSMGNLSDEIDNDIDRVLVGYKYEKSNWTFSSEVSQLTARGKVVINNNTLIDDDIKFIDTFTYLSYDFIKTRLYGVLSTTYKDDEMGDYVKYANLYNIQKNNDHITPDPKKIELLNSDNHKSISLSLGAVYDLTDDIILRLERTYIKSKGIERVLNTKSGAIRDEDSSYFGFSITHSF